MNLLHFGFGVGNLIVPQIARPFLSPDKEDGNITREATFFDILNKDNIDESRIEVAYAIIAILVLLVAVIQLALIIKGAPEGFPHWIPQGKLKAMVSPGSCARGNIFYGVELLVVLLLYYGCDSGASRSYFELIFSIVTEGNLELSKAEASTLQSVFWICFTLGRGLSSPITAFIRVQLYLTVVIVLLVIVSMVIALLGSQVLLVMWICNCCFGFLISVPFPNGMAWANLYLDMNSMATMVLLMGNSFGGLVFQAWAGYVYDNHSPDAVLYLPAVGCIILAVLFGIGQSIAYFQGDIFRESAVIFHEEINDIDSESVM